MATCLLLVPGCIDHALDEDLDAAAQREEASVLTHETGSEFQIVDADLVYDAYTLVPEAAADASAPEPTPPACALRPGEDHDGDGYAANDCDDCDDAINPGAYDVPGNALDEDCSGAADDEPPSCDAMLALLRTTRRKPRARWVCVASKRGKPGASAAPSG
jgi:hypothetical protein